MATDRARIDTSITQILESMISSDRPVYLPQPYHNIVMVDSRMWDPGWRRKDNFKSLANVLSYLVGPARGITVASQSSYWWGRDPEPERFLSSPRYNFERLAGDLTYESIRTRVELVVRRVMDGVDVRDAIRRLSFVGPSARAAASSSTAAASSSVAAASSSVATMSSSAVVAMLSPTRRRRRSQ